MTEQPELWNELQKSPESPTNGEFEHGGRKTDVSNDEALLPAVNEKYQRDLDIRPTWNVEANFMVLPIFCFDKRGVSKDSAQILRSMPAVIDGTVVTRQLMVSSGHREHNGEKVPDSRPGAFDMSLLFCLMDLWDEQGRSEEGNVVFRLSDLCNRLRLTDAGKNFEAIRNSILRLSRTKIESKNAFFSKENAKYLTISMSIIDDATIVSAVGTNGAKAGCSVTLGKHILSNLKNNFTAKLNRQIYQQLENGFSQRLLCLILFKQQILNEVGVIDFELMELAEALPMNGKLFPSTVKDRLSNALAELKEKKIFKSEFLKHGRKHILRLQPFEAPEIHLVGPFQVVSFFEMTEHVYKRSFTSITGIMESAVSALLEKNTKVIECENRKYSWVFHVADIVAFMLTVNKYKADDPIKLFSYLLKKSEDELEIPLNWKPIDLRCQELKKKTSLENAANERDNKTKEADATISQMSDSYIDMLSNEEFSHYQKIVEEQNPMMLNLTKGGRSSPFLRGNIKSLIIEDLKKGKQFTFGKTLPNQAASPMLPNSSKS